jgi:hypothetical protein
VYRITFDVTETVESMRKIAKHDWPEAIVDAFGDIAQDAQKTVRQNTEIKYRTHSDFITNGIKATPVTSTQKRSAENALRTYGDFDASVYLRPSYDPRRSLAFMTSHEYGTDRDPKDKWIATPTRALKSKGYRTGSGRVAKRWRPSTLLQRYNQTGGRLDGDTTKYSGKRQKRGRRLPGTPFIVEGRGGKPMIARRVRRGNKPLEFLYTLVDTTKYNKTWEFTDTVYDTVMRVYVGRIKEAVRRLPHYS